jgi:YfiH family protein
MRLVPFQEAGCLALFTTRPLSVGGVVPGGEAVMASRAAFARSCLPRAPVVVRQVHGARVLSVGAGPPGEDAGEWPVAGEADGLVTSCPDLPLAVFCADCAAVYLYDPGPRVIGLLHAGWRGTVAGVVEQGLAAMTSTGCDPRRVLAAVGPCIGPCCYEIGDDVKSRIHERLGEDAVRVLLLRDGRLHFDLRGAISILLQRCGVPSGHVLAAGPCTACRPDLFWSHRRDGGVTGRMAAVLALRA